MIRTAFQNETKQPIFHFPFLQRPTMKHLAGLLLLKLGGNDTPSAADVTEALSTVGVEVDDAKLSALMTELEGKNIDELIEAGKEHLAKFGGGGGGGGGGAGGDAVEEVAVEEEEEEEADIGPAVDMFGGGDEAGGDY